MMRHLRTRRADDDRGVALIEFAISVTILLTLVFGIVEFGLAWQDRLMVENAARAGTRVGSSRGTDRYADYDLLQSVKSALRDVGLANIDYVVVFKSTTTDGAIPAGCSGATPASQSGKCNVYTGVQLQSLTKSDFVGAACSGAPDVSWCPVGRQNSQLLGPDYLGVWIKAEHQMISGLFGQTNDVTASSVMRLEPKVA